VYYLAGSIIAGSVMGAGFATNLSPRPKKKQLEALQKLGTYVPLNLEGIDGGLIAKPDERRPTIVYIHGRSANRTELAPLAEMLFREGYNAVLWDSKSRQISYGPKEIDQVGRIVRTVRENPHVVPNEVYLLGFSLGGAIAIGAAAADSNGHIRGIIADSPYADLIGAVYGALKNCVNVSERRIPLLALPQGGVDAPSKKNAAKPPWWAQTGWFSASALIGKPPRPRDQGCFAAFRDRSATPPCGDARRGIWQSQTFWPLFSQLR
jgi:pimeloyl-ACP methyl ester carboxylesterase